jgi:hypothetical protein
MAEESPTLLAPSASGIYRKLGMNDPHYDSGQLQDGRVFIAFAIICAIVQLPLASKSSSAILFILILGGLFAGVPATLGLGVILAQLKHRKNQYGREKTSTDPLPKIR